MIMFGEEMKNRLDSAKGGILGEKNWNELCSSIASRLRTAALRENARAGILCGRTILSLNFWRKAPVAPKRQFQHPNRKI